MPVATLALAMGVLSLKTRELARLERKSEELGERVAAAERSAAGRHAGNASVDRPDVADAGTIRWDQVASNIYLERRLWQMDAAELLESHKDLLAQEMPDEAREHYEWLLVGVLMEKNPRLLIEQFTGHLDDPDSRLGARVDHAFGLWMGEEPRAALAWLDARIAAGDLESSQLNGWNQSRMNMEASVLPWLLKLDPAAASARIGELPEDHRAWVLQMGMRSAYEPETGMAFVALLRERIPRSYWQQAYSGVVDSMVGRDGRLDRISAFMDEVGVSSDERSLIASQAAQARIGSSVEWADHGAVVEVLDWLAEEVPGEGGKITGEVLGWGGGFAERVALVETLHHSERGSDELLIGFLGGIEAMDHRETSRRLALLIEDEQRRAEMLEKLREPEGGP